MKITYLHHSSFLVELEQVSLLFDYAGGPFPAPNPDKDLLVFASHRHGDHFSPDIFRLADTHRRPRFILSDDIWQNRVPEPLGCWTEFMDSGRVKHFSEGAGVRVTAFHSTDEGVAFLVETEGVAIYHAGDLNDWKWNGETKAWNNNMSANYKRELAKLHDTGITPDIAMLPLDPRQEEWFYLGLHEFMEQVGANWVFPMHFWEDYSVISRLKAMPLSENYRSRIADISKEGQVFER